MGWRLDEVWLDTDLLWFSERPAMPRADRLDAAVFTPIATGLDASRRRRLAAQAERRRRLATRTVPAVALVLGSATMIPMWVFRSGGSHDAGPLRADPPSLTFRLDGTRFEVVEGPIAPPRAAVRKPATRPPERERDVVEIEWRSATSIGLPYAGRLLDGTQLPVEGPDWVTWNPVSDSVPNQPHRLYGHERTIRTVLAVIAAYRAAHPDAPRVVVGDISFRDGGTMDQHVSHQNGLDVDVYYPRRDGRLHAPVTSSQIDRGLAQDLLDRFVAAGAQIVFVGYSTGLHGSSGVVVPYPNHENHMHVRFPPPG
jgi:hypothetical protein